MAVTRVDLDLSASVDTIDASKMTQIVEMSKLRELMEYASSAGHHITVVLGLQDLQGQDVGSVCVSLCPTAKPCGEGELYDQVISEIISLFKRGACSGPDAMRARSRNTRKRL